jgi:hypothetical protein
MWAMPHTSPLQHSRLPASPTYSALLFTGIRAALPSLTFARRGHGDERSGSHLTACAVYECKRVSWQKQQHRRPAQRAPLSTLAGSSPREERRYGARTVSKPNSTSGAISRHAPRRSRSRIGPVDRLVPVHAMDYPDSPCLCSARCQPSCGMELRTASHRAYTTS